MPQLEALFDQVLLFARGMKLLKLGQIALARLNALPEAFGSVTELLAGTGYFSGANVNACVEGKIQSSVAVARDQHHLSVFDRFAPDTPAPITDDPVVLMKRQLTTEAGRVRYTLRKKTVEPVLGIIKHVMGLRQFSIRVPTGPQQVRFIENFTDAPSDQFPGAISL